MRKIIVGAQISIDGVMQAPGGPTEDPTDGFPFGGWAMTLDDPAFREEITELFARPFDLLLGRKTYEIFAAFWPYQSNEGRDGSVAQRLNEVTKYTVSRSGNVDTGWAKSVLLRDVDAVKQLQQQSGTDLLTQGSTELVHALLAADLVDAICIFMLPVVLGRGKKLFADGSAPHAFKLTRSRVGKSGLIVGHYERDGQVKTGNAAAGFSSEREAARQARMKREA